jgi:hyperosmotically inducible protein
MLLALPFVSAVFMLPLVSTARIPIHLVNSSFLSKKRMKQLLFPFLASLLMICTSQGQQATPTPHDPAASHSTEGDNTSATLLSKTRIQIPAEKQSNSKDDLALTQKVRQAVMKDGSLSMNAKNVKIIA